MLKLLKHIQTKHCPKSHKSACGFMDPPFFERCDEIVLEFVNKYIGTFELESHDDSKAIAM